MSPLHMTCILLIYSVCCLSPTLELSSKKKETFVSWPFYTNYQKLDVLKQEKHIVRVKIEMSVGLFPGKNEEK